MESRYPRGHILLKSDKVETSIYFIKKGMVRTYTNSGDAEISFWFGREGDSIISMNSYVANRKGYENIELLENCELYEQKTTILRKFFDQDIHMANWWRGFAEQELIKTEERLISRQFRSATERYTGLLKDRLLSVWGKRKRFRNEM